MKTFISLRLALIFLFCLTLTFPGTSARADIYANPAAFAYTAPAAYITFSGAALYGAATPDSSSAGAWFQWGSTLQYGNVTPVQAVSGGNLVWLHAPLTGLALNQIYHYRLVVTNQNGTFVGGDQQFVTGGRLFLYSQDDWDRLPLLYPHAPITGVAAGFYSAMAMLTNGTIYNFGDNSPGGAPSDLTNDFTMAVGFANGMAVRSNGTMEAWGDDTYGETAIPAAATNVVEVASGDYFCLALRNDGTVFEMGNPPGTSPGNIPANGTNVVAIAVGTAHAVALLNNGTVVCWGNNQSGQTNVPAGLTNIVAIAAGDANTLALRSDGKMFAWGADNYGQSDIPAAVTNVVAIAGGTEQTMALRTDGTMIMWGALNYSQTTPTIANMAGGGGGTAQDGDFSFFVQPDQPPVPNPQTNSIYNQLGQFVIGLSGQDPDGDSISYNITSLPRLGTLYQNNGGSPGAQITTVPTPVASSVIFVPPAGANGSPYDTFGFSATDGELNSAPATETIDVIPPTATPQTVSTYNQSGQYVITLSGQDPGATALTFSIASLPNAGTLYQYNSGVPGAAITATGTTVTDASGRVIFIPTTHTGAPFATVFDFLAHAGPLVATAPAVITVNVGAQDTATPQLVTNTPSLNTTITLSGTDTDGAVPAFIITTLPQVGSLYQYGSGSPGAAISAPNTTVTDSGGRVIFVPVAGQTGTPYDTFSFAVNDNVFESATATVTLDIVPLIIYWNNSSSGNWTNAANWSPQQVPGLGDIASITTAGGTITNSNPVTVSGLIMSVGGATLTGSGVITVAGSLNWTGGNISGTVQFNGGSLNGSLDLFGTLVNSGVFTWNGSLYCFGGQFTNQVSGTVNATPGMGAYFENGSSAFNNLGQFNVSGTGTVNMEIPFNNSGVATATNNGTLELSYGGSETGLFTVASGATLDLANGSFTFSGSGGVGGTGLMQINGSIVNFSGTGNATNALMLNGTLNVTCSSPLTPASAAISGGTEEGSQTLQVLNAGGFSWTGGAIYGTVEFNGGSINGSQDLFGTLANSGTLAWTGSLFCFGGQFTNQASGTVNVAPGNSAYAENGSPTFNNLGQFNVTGPSPVQLEVPFNNTGSITVSNTGTLNLSDGGALNGSISNNAGATLQLGGGTFSSSAGSTLAGTGNFTVSGGIANLSGTLNFGGTNTFSGGTANITGAGDITNVLLITGGTLNLGGNGTAAPWMATINGGSEAGSQTLQVTGGGGFLWSGGSINGTVQCNGGNINGSLDFYGALVNDGALTWNGSLYCFGGQFTNQVSGTVNVAPGSSTYAENGSPVFNNLGQLNVSGTGTVNMEIPFLNSGVAMATNKGTLELSDGGVETGVFTVASGATLELAGNPFTFGGGGSVGGTGVWQINGSTVNFSGTGNATNALMLINGTLNLTCASPLTPASASISGGNEEGSQTLQVLGAGGFSWTSGTIYGTVKFNGGSLSGNLDLDGALVNSGSLAWSGSLYCFGGQFTNQASGTVNAAPGTDAYVENGLPAINNLGQFNVSGPGTVDLSVPFNNSGTVNIQSGTLDLADGVSLANGTLDFDITGDGDNGTLTVSGNVALAGTLAATFLAYAPHVGDAFTLINYTSETGTFTGFNLSAGLNFQKTYGANSFTLTLTNIIQFFNVTLAAGQPAFTPAGFNVVVAGPTGSNYTLQVSTNLAQSNWATVTNFISTAPFTTVFDTNSTNFFPGRWYRAMVP